MPGLCSSFSEERWAIGDRTTEKQLDGIQNSKFKIQHSRFKIQG
jgi:hypothetical protein